MQDELGVVAVAEASVPLHNVNALDLAVLILTYNEAIHIERAISSVRGIARDILVVDSFSTDSTVELARCAGARVIQNKFVNQSKQFQWGLDNGDIGTTWIMRLDADEIIEPDLVAEITRDLPGMPETVVGVNFNRKHIFMGRWVRHGGRFPLRLLRLWRRGKGRVEDRWMDEHIVVWGGSTVTMKGGFSDANENDLTFFTEKHNKYATREAVEVLSQRYGLLPRDEAFNAQAVSRQAGIKRWVKESIYNRLPFWVGPLGYFLYRYFLQLGFLDGRSGLIYHFLQGFWYRFLVGAKVEEFEAKIADCTSNEERRERLALLTGLKIAG
jgi:glycosyltransferase involved in cell wall biosynthesis